MSRAMPNIDPVLKRSPELKEYIARARKLAIHRDFEGAQREYRNAVRQAKVEFSEDTADYGLVLLELADFYESCGRDVELYGIRCKTREILKRYAASYMFEDSES